MRLPIGLMFAVLGVVLGVYGFFSDPALYARSLGINVNLWWGLVLLVFGATMLSFALRARRREGEAGPPAGPPR